MKNYRKDLCHYNDSMGVFNGRRGLTDVFDNFSKLLDNMWKVSDISVFNEIQPRSNSSSFPKINVVDNDTSYEVQMAIAGFNKENVDLEIKENSLYIKCDSNEVKEESKKYLIKEIVSRSFRRVLNFTEKVDVNSVSCTYNNGVITCIIDKLKKDGDEPVKISIE